ncbi:MAG: methylenetetrahydrofolate reductase [Actinomycetota bacterium]|jgi:methylenetetrahydrofolate reductase (NADPH)|nr:methylenetetrahydrofolate reductase [Actinomycetota bacterium]
MAKIAELLRAGRTLSFEFGPPRDDRAERELHKALLKLEELGPSFTSVTYGALGSTKDKTREIVEHIHRDTSMVVMPHLTCVGHTRAQISAIVTDYRDMGIENLLALGGDPPADGRDQASDFEHATELIDAARELGDFSIGVAAFPEVHPRSPDRDSDRRHLAAKLLAADFGITNFGFHADDYFRMVDELAALGVDTPVLPGVMLFVNVDGLRRMATINRVRIPESLDSALDAVHGNPAEVRKLAVEWGSRLTQELLDGGAPGIHFYTLNASRATLDVYARLGLGPSGS